MRLLPAAAATLMLSIPACASRPSPDLREGIIDARRERTCSFEEMIDDLATVRMVFIGETHTNPAHHELQRRILEELTKRRPRLLVGLEMMQRPYQEFLDRWCEGGMEEEAFLREANWYGQWNDWDLYGPILRLARDCRIRAIALNVDRTYIAEVRIRGLLNLPPWIRAKLPDDIDLSVKAHRKALREVFASPGSREGDEGEAEDRFRRYYEAQITWDEVMAETAVKALAAEPEDAAIVVLAGSFHVKDFHAIPERARRRNGLDYRVVLPMEVDAVPKDGIKVGMGRSADYVVFTPPTPLITRVKFGVDLRGGDTVVKTVAEGSTAAAAGLREGDVLIAVDERKIADPVDIELALETRIPGDRVRVRWRRDGADMEAEVLLPEPPRPSARQGSPHSAPPVPPK